MTATQKQALKHISKIIKDIKTYKIYGKIATILNELDVSDSARKNILDTYDKESAIIIDNPLCEIRKWIEAIIIDNPLCEKGKIKE